jgi:protoporphyrinogen oxidase
MKKVVVIGGGLAGLSAAFHLQEHEPVVFEKESVIGGLCRSVTQDGFTFDVTGHLIHLKNPYTRDLIDQILPGRLTPHQRLACIHSKGVNTPYPFQANTYGLPLEVVKECVVGFVETLQRGRVESNNFHDWVLNTFGSGIAAHFMLPFNEKFWKQDLRNITADWVSWSIPKPKLDEVINGALGLTNTGMGYNPKFLYPRDGGIDCLPQALAKPLQTIHTEHTLESINSKKKVVRFANGREEHYDSLVSTAPLPVLYELIKDAPENLKAAAKKLSIISVLDFNIGVDRPNISDQHWIYFPEDQFIFTRIGFPSNFSEAVAPPGTSSVYIELTYQPHARPNLEEAYERSIADLQKCGILRPDDRILTLNTINIPYAYVVFDEHRQKHVNTLLRHLEANDIFSAGRYGRWEYFSMEDSILSGRAASEAILTRMRHERSSSVSV